MRTEHLKIEYGLEKHPEGGWFREVYSSEGSAGGRAFAGSIYFLLDKGDISHFHVIDCEEIWYYHEGCGMKIYVINGGKPMELLLGSRPEKGEKFMAVIPKGAAFAAENTDPEGYTFVSCATAPKFSYDGFQLLGKKEIMKLCPEFPEDLLYLAMD